MLALLKLPLPECATEQRVAVLIDAISEVLTGHGDDAVFSAAQVAFVEETPFLRAVLARRLVFRIQCSWMDSSWATFVHTSEQSL